MPISYLKKLQFQQPTQKSDETVDQLITHVCKLAEICEFTNLDN